MYSSSLPNGVHCITSIILRIGRSRNLIIRELQRTNLDVNLAVNNLLSRDEEDGDDADDAQDNYVPEVSWNQSLLKHKPRKSCAFLRTGHPKIIPN